jgi:hypothetical protein
LANANGCKKAKKESKGAEMNFGDADRAGSFHGLTPEKLQLFVAGLSGLDPEEVRKAKLLFVRNELRKLKAMHTSLAGFGAARGCFSVIPIFWPILSAQNSSMNAILTLQKDQIRNALQVWRDELGEDGRAIERELQAFELGR